MRRPSKKRRSSLARFIVSSVLVVIVALLAVGFYGYRWFQNYLRSDAFRAQIAVQLGRAAKANATVEPLTWTGPDVHVNGVALSPKAAQGWKSIGADGVQASLDFGAARDGVWRVRRLSADTLRIGMRSAAEIPKNPPSEFEEPPPSSVPQWLRRWIPTRTQIDEVEVQTFEFSPPAGTEGVSASGVSLSGKPANDTGAWQVIGQGGKIALPGIKEPLRIMSVNTRLDDKALVFHDSSARWLGDSEVTARGDLPFDRSRPWSFNGTVANLDVRHVINGEWSSRMGGVLEAPYQVSATMVKANIRCKNGVVQNLPVLNLLATFTKLERFRRIVLDVASADVEKTAEVVKVTNLNLQSKELLRVEGGFTIQNGEINGDLLVGLAPDKLQWLPNSQERVFTETRQDAPGYVWTKVHLNGPANAPREDLTNRVMVAIGMAPLDLASKGVEILTGAAGGTGSVPVKQASEAVKGTAEQMLKGSGDAAGKAVETGVDIIKGVVPILGK